MSVKLCSLAKLSTCTEHPNEPLRFYCTFHNDVICSLCAIKRHKLCQDTLTFHEAIERFEREYLNISKAIETQKRVLERTIDERQIGLHRLNEREDTSSAQITQLCDNLIAVIEDKKRELLQTLSIETETTRNELTNDLTSLKNMLATIFKVQDKAENAFESKSQLKTIKTMIKVQNTYCDIEKSCKIIINHTVDRICFEQSDELHEFLASVHNIGTIERQSGKHNHVENNLDYDSESLLGAVGGVATPKTKFLSWELEDTLLILESSSSSESDGSDDVFNLSHSHNGPLRSDLSMSNDFRPGDDEDNECKTVEEDLITFNDNESKDDVDGSSLAMREDNTNSRPNSSPDEEVYVSELTVSIVNDNGEIVINNFDNYVSSLTVKPTEEEVKLSTNEKETKQCTKSISSTDSQMTEEEVECAFQDILRDLDEMDGVESSKTANIDGKSERSGRVPENSSRKDDNGAHDELMKDEQRTYGSKNERSSSHPCVNGVDYKLKGSLEPSDDSEEAIRTDIKDIDSQDGDITQTTDTFAKPVHLVPVDTKQFQTVDHGRPCWIYGVEFVLNDRIVLADVAHDSLQLYTINGDFRYEKRVAFTPWDIARVDEGTIAVCSGMKGSVAIFKVTGNGFEEINTIDIGFDCNSITFGGSGHFENSRRFIIGSRQGCVIVSENGKDLIKLDTNSRTGDTLRRTDFISVDKEHGHIYMVNSWSGKLTAVKASGELIWEQNTECVFPRGIVARQDTLLISCKSQNCVNIIDATDGKHVGNVVSEHIECPYAIAHHPIENLLVVTRWEEKMTSDDTRTVVLHSYTQETNRE